MKIYNYDNYGEFISETDARLDPRETAAQGVDVFRIPRNATTVKPPASTSGQVRVFDEVSETWSKIDDPRDKVLYSKETGEVFVPSDLGYDEGDYTEESPETELDVWDDNLDAWVSDMPKVLSDYRDEVLYSGITVNGVTIPTDNLTQNRMAGARIKADSDADFVFKWKVGGAFIDLDQAAIISISDAILVHVQNCFTAESQVDPEDHDTVADLKSAYDTAFAAL